jgi:hypothetical protein
MLNPDKVVSYFVAFVTIFVVAFVKISGMMAIMREAEKSLHLTLLKKRLGKDIDLTEQDMQEAIELSADKLREYLSKKGLDPADVNDILKRVTSFRRFRVLYATK